MNNTPTFPPAERLGIALMGLIHALAKRAGWLLPRWVIAMMEEQVRGLVEALSLLAAQVAESKLAASGQPEPATHRPPGATAEQTAPPVRRGTARRRRPAARPGQTQAAPERSPQPRRRSRRTGRGQGRIGPGPRRRVQRPYPLKIPPLPARKISA